MKWKRRLLTRRTEPVSQINRRALATANEFGWRLGQNLNYRTGQSPTIRHMRYGLMILGLVVGSVMALTALAPAQAQDAGAADVEVKAGLDVWKTSGCSVCHGKFGQGGGGGEQPAGPSLRVSKLDHAGIVEQITVAGGDMPAFEGILTPEEIRAVATFLMAQVVGNGDVTLEECTFYYGPYQGGLHPSCRRYQ